MTFLEAFAVFGSPLLLLAVGGLVYAVALRASRRSGGPAAPTAAE